MELVQLETSEKVIKRKKPDGVATNQLIFSSYITQNTEVFKNVLSLYVSEGAIVADVTYGKGAFWRSIDKEKYKLHKSDISTGVDCRNLPYKENSIDCVVFDPPYMHTPGGSTHGTQNSFEQYYQNNATQHEEKKYHEAVLDLYFTGAAEAFRVLKNKGILIIKCQDEVCANKQRLTHVEIINELVTYGFIVEDLFVVMRNNKPGVSRVKQQIHARKNHSYFLVFRKKLTIKKEPSNT